MDPRQRILVFLVGCLRTTAYLHSEYGLQYLESDSIKHGDWPPGRGEPNRPARPSPYFQRAQVKVGPGRHLTCPLAQSFCGEGRAVEVCHDAIRQLAFLELDSDSEKQMKALWVNTRQASATRRSGNETG